MWTWEHCDMIGIWNINVYLFIYIYIYIKQSLICIFLSIFMFTWNPDVIVQKWSLKHTLSISLACTWVTGIKFHKCNQTRSDLLKVTKYIHEICIWEELWIFCWCFVSLYWFSPPEGGRSPYAKQSDVASDWLVWNSTFYFLQSSSGGERVPSQPATDGVWEGNANTHQNCWERKLHLITELMVFLGFSRFFLEWRSSLPTQRLKDL